MSLQGLPSIVTLAGIPDNFRQPQSLLMNAAALEVSSINYSDSRQCSGLISNSLFPGINVNNKCHYTHRR